MHESVHSFSGLLDSVTLLGRGNLHIPPVATENVVITLPFLRTLCNGGMHTSPAIMACKKREKSIFTWAQFSVTGVAIQYGRSTGVLSIEPAPSVW